MNRRCLSNWELLEHTFHESLRSNAKLVDNRKVLVRSSLNTRLLSNCPCHWSWPHWSLRLAEGQQLWQRGWKLNRALLLMTLYARLSHEKRPLRHIAPQVFQSEAQNQFPICHALPGTLCMETPNLFLREVWLKLFLC